ncbi:hypothetical protein [Demequina zhanjiangensis]|uniref:Thioredoxin domain-containing protein n=1 Tax=Demequina zhanjiangensis TaxID=3051659 RepID=A0ABT8FXK6_9MICO|nr:hypothetical protein [Demequina sp. SYSU T00b26]MDN4471636.1 hypothetical protein [Demequina sp. SYSU T00b26]
MGTAASSAIRRRVAMPRLLLVLALAVTLLAATPWTAHADDPGITGGTDLAAEAGLDPASDLVLFWGDGCPHCAAEKEWLTAYSEQHPELTLTYYEVWYDEANQQLLMDTAAVYGFEVSGVPTTMVGNNVWIGWSESIQAQVQAALEAGLDPSARPTDDGTGTAGDVVDVPLVGEVSLNDHSLLVSTVIIGFVDGVNPCSLWVISVLLAIVLRTGSRRRVLVVGSTFLAVTAAMYALYMAAFYSALTVIGWMGWIQVVVAAVAGIFGIVSVKDYFAFKQGLSFTISDSAKPGIYKRMRAIAGQDALLPALGATVVLAVGVSLLETPCTAGFPVLWTGMLHANDVGPAATVGLFVAYMIPFLLDELVVFGLAVVTMRATKFQDKHGELLKLFAGVTMLVLAAVMLIDPTLMESPLLALALFAGAFLLAGVIHLVTTRIRATHASSAKGG